MAGPRWIQVLEHITAVSATFVGSLTIYLYLYIIYKKIYIHCIAINDIAVFVKLDSYGKYLMAIYCGLAVSSYAYILRTESVAV